MNGLLFGMNIAALVWLGITWRKSGFLAALNLFLYGTLMVVAALRARNG